MNRSEFAALVDHTILKPDATFDQVADVAREAMALGCASVCVNSERVRTVKPVVAAAGLAVCSVIGFPFGTVPTLAKITEMECAATQGATEFDMVIDLGAVKSGDFDKAWSDIHLLRQHGLPDGAVLKVILETAALTPAEIVEACVISRDAGADFVKTSTGFHPAGGATVEAVALMAKTVPDLGVKASGGVRDLPTALAMLGAGATRLGMSATRSVLAGLDG